ncbi:ABC-three component system protein [Adhaeribacter rhizoryzae]|uniref:ABC-three component systems C-terminal domain-containing protein n=1 Tax=Adhaeribacter rhizoryzae TaxID=2607907 RepID=A0A5M6D5N5_9BACT|nr:ABC-three component system protein [Adhaeribacter rhizoryzae]KAA5542066.1 hypothetical protein F0145_19970 [Adhaeribacter rhizoryzae]
MGIDLQYEKYTVKVDAGTGCLIQSNSDKESYILTAKHNIKDTLNGLREINVIRIGKKDKLNVRAVYKSETIDIAILVVDYIKDLNLLVKAEIEDYAPVIMYGYPDLRKGEEIQAKKLPCKCIQFHKETFFNEFEPTKAQTQADIVGFSGCGVFEEINNELFLVGIQFRMAESNGPEGRMFFYPINEFQKLADLNKLKGFSPYYLGDFSKLVDCTFEELKNEVDKVTSKVLKTFALKEIIAHVNPNMIINKLEHDVLTKKDKSFIHHFNLWLGWLEFLILNAIGRSIKCDDTDWWLNLVKNKRFLFKHTQDWISEIEDIHKTANLKGLDNNGIIIINSFPDKALGRTIIPLKKIPKISDVLESEMEIDKSEGFDPYNLKIIHHRHFIKQIIDDENICHYTSAQEKEIIESIRVIIDKVYGN